jgi:hypothetical protein
MNLINSCYNYHVFCLFSSDVNLTKRAVSSYFQSIDLKKICMHCVFTKSNVNSNFLSMLDRKLPKILRQYCFTILFKSIYVFIQSYHNALLSLISAGIYWLTSLIYVYYGYRRE